MTWLGFCSSNHINIRMLGHRIKRIKPLDEEAAVQKGADLMGEVIVYSISVGTILFEFNRRNADAKKKEALKAVRRKKKAEDYETRMAFINDEIGTMKAQVDEIREEVLKMKLRRKSTVSWLFSSEPGVENTTTASSRTLSFSKLLPSIKSLQPPRPNLEKQP